MTETEDDNSIKAKKCIFLSELAGRGTAEAFETRRGRKAL
jgi:hypothetical protein